MSKPLVKINKSVGIIGLFAFLAIGINLVSANLHFPEASKIQVKDISVKNSFFKFGENNNYDALVVLRDVPFHKSLLLVRQVAFSYSRCASIDYKFVGFDKDENKACNFKTYFDLNHINFFDTVSSIVFKSLKIPFCPIRARVSHGPPFEQLS